MTTTSTGPARPPAVAGRGDQHRPGRRQPLGRHPPDPARPHRGGRHRRLPQGRVDAPHRLPQAPVGPLAVPLRPVQRLAARGHHGHRGLVRLDRGQRGLLRADARAALHRGRPARHQPAKAGPDRAPGRSLPLRRQPERGVRRRDQARGRDRRVLPGPVHPRRAGHRLARQQQHRRVDLHPDGARAAPGADLGGRRCRHRGHQRDHRALHALPPGGHPARGRGPGGVGLLPSWVEDDPGCVERDRVADRGHRSGPRGAQLHPPP